MNGAPPTAIVDAVRAELAVPGRYQLHVIPRHASLVGRMLEWLWARWNDFVTAIMSHVKIGRAGTSLIGDVVVALCVLAIAAIAAHLLGALQYERMRRDAALGLASARSAHALAAAAAQAAGAADFARAIRFTFMAAVTMLDLRGVMRADRAATVNELRAELHERDARCDSAFAEIARLYTEAAYAQAPAGEEAWRRARAAYDELAATAS